MLQLRSRLNVADNSGAKKAWAIGVLGIRKDTASVGDVIKAHVREAAPDGNVKKGEVVNDERAFGDVDNFVTDDKGQPIPRNSGTPWQDSGVTLFGPED